MLKENPSIISEGDVVQINPESDKVFGGCFLVVESVRTWGVLGYVSVPGKGLAYYRAKNEDFVRIGIAEWKTTIS